MRGHRGMRWAANPQYLSPQEKEPLPQPQGCSRGQNPWDRGYPAAGVSGDTLCITPRKRSIAKWYRAC